MTTQSSVSRTQSDLPGYVEERRAYAEAAGLRCERQVRKGDALSSIYSGSEAQFRASRLLRIASGFVFPATVGMRRAAGLAVFSPAAPHAAFKCSLSKIGEDRYRLALSGETLPVSWRALGANIAVYQFCDLREGAHTGPATVYMGTLAALKTTGIAPATGATPLRRAERRIRPPELQAVGGGLHRFAVHHEDEARAQTLEEERGRSHFRDPKQYQDWLLEVAAASIGMIRRQLRVKTRGRLVYTIPAQAQQDLEAHFAHLRKTLARTEIIVHKEDMGAEERRAELRQAGLAALRDAQFQRFLGAVITTRSREKD